MQTQEHRVVEPLKAISLSYTAGSAPGTADLIATPRAICFVYGLGVDGLTPFEAELDGKAVGDQVQYRLAGSRVPEIFGHLINDLDALPIKQAEFYLNVRVDDIGEVDSRQLVHALAAATSCGGDCGCGCGGH